MSSPSKDEKKANYDSKEAQSNDKKTTYVDLQSQPGKKQVASKLLASEENETYKGILKTNQTSTPSSLPPSQRVDIDPGFIKAAKRRRSLKGNVQEMEAKKLEFEQKRRSHYDEAHKMAEARKLIAVDDAQLEIENADKQSKESQAVALANRHKAAVAAEEHEQERKQQQPNVKNLMERGGKEKVEKKDEKGKRVITMSKKSAPPTPGQCNIL